VLEAVAAERGRESEALGAQWERSPDEAAGAQRCPAGGVLPREWQQRSVKLWKMGQFDGEKAALTLRGCEFFRIGTISWDSFCQLASSSGRNPVLINKKFTASPREAFFTRSVKSTLKLTQ